MDDLSTRDRSPATGTGHERLGQDPDRDVNHRPTRPVGGSRLARRRRILLAVGAGTALLAVGGLIGAAFVKSPAQLAADTAPPPTTVTTALVTGRALAASVAMRGVVYPSTQYDVYATAQAGGGPVYLSTEKIKPGAAVRSGELLAEIDGAPLFVLTGTVPAWRDLAPGEHGPDVAELQNALIALGYRDGDTAGFYGAGTEHAVDAFYDHLGYTAPTSSSRAGDAASAGGSHGPQMPQADVLFLPSLPATVITVNGAVGQQPGTPFLILSTPKALTITGELPPAYASQVKTGLPVTVSDEATGITATGTVAKIGTPTLIEPTGTTVNIGATANSSTGGSGASGAGAAGSTLFVPVTVSPTTPLPAALNGENVLVTIETSRSGGAVLTVPVAAIVTTASGQSSVTVVGAGGTQTTVPITVGMSAAGYVQVTAHTAGTLTVGDTVVVGG